jgi:uncharacterized protein YcgL (UPF0745 family)
MESISCFVYRSERKQGLYVYLTEKDNFDIIPDALRKRVGSLVFTFEFDLTESRKLSRNNTKEVMQSLAEKGYFLQMPPANTNFLDLDLHQSDGF